MQQRIAKKQRFQGISSFTLHILGMIFMFCDHMWATIIPGNQWLTWVGRLSFPIFAFMIAEGYFQTKDFKKYLKRMLVFALISEIPFNLMYTGLWIYPFHQNVLWTFVFALLCMRAMDKVREKHKQNLLLKMGLCILLSVFYMLAAQLTMVDYYSYGVLMVLVFYFLRGDSWLYKLGQFAAMFYINWEMINGMVVPVNILGLSLEIPQQGFAVLALIPIWLYQGRQGPYNKVIKYAYYWFYPVHLLVLGLIGAIM